jgi:hypothetical protein
VAQAKKPTRTTRRAVKTSGKSVPQPRKRAVAKKTGEGAAITKPDDASEATRSQTSARQAEHLGLLSLALLFALVGLAVHVLWFVAIVLMAILLGLTASELRSNRGGGVVSDVVSTMMSESKSLADDVTHIDASQLAHPEPQGTSPSSTA